MPCFSWREEQNPDDPFVHHSAFTFHPRHDGILLSMHTHMADKDGKRFNHNQASYFASFEQVIEIANFLLIYLREINEKRAKNEIT